MDNKLRTSMISLTVALSMFYGMPKDELLLRNKSEETLSNKMKDESISMIDTDLIKYKIKTTEAKNIINDRQFKSSLDLSELTDLLIYIDTLCNEYGLKYNYIKAIIANESRWDANAKGSSKDYGLMQITPIASKAVEMEHSDKLFDAKYNVLSGIKILNHLKVKFDTFEEAIVAYNTGPGRVKRNGLSFVNKHKYLKGVKKWLKKS